MKAFTILPFLWVHFDSSVAPRPPHHGYPGPASPAVGGFGAPTGHVHDYYDPYSGRESREYHEPPSELPVLSECEPMNAKQARIRLKTLRSTNEYIYWINEDGGGEGLKYHRIVVKDTQRTVTDPEGKFFNYCPVELVAAYTPKDLDSDRSLLISRMNSTVEDFSPQGKRLRKISLSGA